MKLLEPQIKFLQKKLDSLIGKPFDTTNNQAISRLKRAITLLGKPERIYEGRQKTKEEIKLHKSIIKQLFVNNKSVNETIEICDSSRETVYRVRRAHLATLEGQDK